MQYRQNSFAARVLRTLFSLTLLLVQAGLEPRHSCPVHDGVSEPADAKASAHGHHQPASDAQPEKSCCTCLGSCLAGSLNVAPTAPPSLTWIFESHQERARIVGADARLTPLPRLLPFATAPPLS